MGYKFDDRILKEYYKQLKAANNPNDIDVIEYLETVLNEPNTYDSDFIYKHKDVLCQNIIDYFNKNNLLKAIFSKTPLYECKMYDLVTLDLVKLTDIIGINASIISEIQRALKPSDLTLCMIITSEDMKRLSDYNEQKQIKKRL